MRVDSALWERDDEEFVLGVSDVPDCECEWFTTLVHCHTEHTSRGEERTGHGTIRRRVHSFEGDKHPIDQLKDLVEWVENGGWRCS